MPATLAFDVYGTLIDTHGVILNLQSMIGNKAADFSQTWRDKQLEYSFRRGLMQNYVNFGICTSQALDYTCQFYQLALTDTQKSELLECYKSLPAFADVPECLARLKQAGLRLYAFSNGSAEAVEGLLKHASIRQFFSGVVSCDDIRSFKPNPATYAYFLRSSGASGDRAWLISSNPFDVIGARSAGMHAAWVQRSGTAVFDPWEIEPTATIGGLAGLDEKLLANP